MFRIHWNNLRATCVAVVLITLTIGRVSRLAYADAVTDWNAIASQATGTAIAAGRPGPATLLDLAIVHVAIHDAVQAFEKRFEPYHVEISSTSGSPVAAVATAAHDVLLNLFPA